MASYFSMKLKRKDLDLDHVNDDVSELTIPSPVRKIRRLEAYLPPTIEQKELNMPSRFEQQPLPEFRASASGESLLRGLLIEELPPVAENQERAIVLFNPINTPLFHSPSRFVVDSALISSIKDQAVWEMKSNSSISIEDQESKADKQLAVIPWVPSLQLRQILPPKFSEMEVSEPMDAEEMGVMMEAEDNIVSSGLQSTNGCSQPNWGSETMQQQWQQQHCLIPQPPQNTAPPIVWYR